MRHNLSDFRIFRFSDCRISRTSALSNIPHRRSTTAFGMLCGILAAVCYGTNPLGALKLYAEGMPTSSVLFYRFGLAWVIIAIVMAVRSTHILGNKRESLRVSRKEFGTLTLLGLLFIVSSLTLYLSFHLMDAGVASTILFTYPVMTAVIMAVFFHMSVWGGLPLPPFCFRLWGWRCSIGVTVLLRCPYGAWCWC